MANPAPKIDERTATTIVQQVQKLLKIYAPAWQEFDPATGKPKGVSAALIGIFGRFAELIIQRLNQVPEKNFLAFLDLLGVSLLPPQPARVPLTFSLAAGSAVDGLVPAGTQVAAPPAEGEKEPVIFETEAELVVTAAQLAAIFTRDPAQDKYADHSAILCEAAPSGIPIFQGNRRIEHIFYLGHSELLGFAEIANLRLTFTLEKPLGDGAELEWQIWDGNTWQTKQARGAPNLTQSPTNVVEFDAMKAVPLRPINSLENRWLRCRLITPITQSTAPRKGMVRAGELPRIEDITIQANLDRSGLDVAPAFLNLLPVETSKEFFPFGEKPKLGDTLYWANTEALSQKDAVVTLPVSLVNPASGGPEPPIPRTNISGNPTLKWEFWDGKAWIELGASSPRTSSRGESEIFEDTTKAFSASGHVRFKLPRQPVAAMVNGVNNYWIRVRIVSGDYGKEAIYRLKVPGKPEEGYVLEPATFAPPAISSIRADYTLTKEEPPQAVLIFNDFAYEEVTPILGKPGVSFAAFQETEDTNPTLYLGFSLPPERTSFPNRNLSLYAQVAGHKYGELPVPIAPARSEKLGDAGSSIRHQFIITNDTENPLIFRLTSWGTVWETTINPPEISLAPGKTQEVEATVAIPANARLGESDRGFLKLVRSDDPSVEHNAIFVTFVGAEPSDGERLQLTWQYWNGKRWADFRVSDQSENFTQPGLVQFLAPPDFSRRNEFGQDRYWLRVQWEKGAYDFEPKLRRALLNTTMAAQTVTLRNEILGSSNGSENQKFRTIRTPVLPGQQLEVREPEMPSAEELAMIEKAEGRDAISSTNGVAGRPKEIWMRWHEVTDFYGSGPRDRHYVLDHLTGEVHFGDGVNGLIPPLGTGNIRLARYQSGGGTAGNKPAGAIVQMKTTVPYVEKVTNPEAAGGGADAEILESLLERGPRTVRHRGRAVTFEDYEDLAVLASPEVARAKCVPLYDLVEDPDATRLRPGLVSAIIVPRSDEVKPVPGLELIDRARDYIDAYRLPNAELVVLGPEYVRVDVEAEIALTALEGASAVELAIVSTLAKFLHPLTGGLDGKGWAFGRKPYKSDLYALIEAIPGVDHVRALKVIETEDRPGKTGKTGRFLVYSGQHKISLV
jgi:hypothetical protein